jgi:hypothetical protein
MVQCGGHGALRIHVAQRVREHARGMRGEGGAESVLGARTGTGHVT